jgi:hypothetical protein
MPDRALVVAERQDRRDRGIRASHLEIIASNAANQKCCDYLRRDADGVLNGRMIYQRLKTQLENPCSRVSAKRFFAHRMNKLTS